MIPVFRPSYDDEEFNAVKEVLKSGWAGLGPKTKEFEEKFAAYIGVKYAVAVNSATAALHLALKVLEIEDAEVITTPMTFVSTNHAILYNKGIPVFADIDADTLNISPDSIKKFISNKTRCILLVHYGGYPCDMDEIVAIARENNLFIVEDCAHACGAEYRGKKVGSIGDLGCFSFHAVKNLATGDGGMITTDNERYYERLIRLRWLGITKDTWERGRYSKYSWYYDVAEVGYKCHMNDIAAAIGIVQLSKLERLNAKREELTGLYNRLLMDIPEVRTPVLKPDRKSAYHNYVIKAEKRDELNQYLAGEGVSTSVHYFPNNHYEIYRGYKGDTPISDEVWKKIMTLPLFPDLRTEDVHLISNKIKGFYGGP
ncbi:MAG: DegT/DnrJ/EryC1/StrS family aminotransferase [Syntrophorhabdales bacterium]|nr:DegT/DnrJ/EryC1/StrS family aminotransferase [Syntrophorhabdales bacterium]